ncbi:DNA polymerase I [Propionimicrobium sp. PCR01-08-3]|uniref:DNA polymerase I n=1 Tax=Propionimicrobium sp. PCR01-08-3 TaxID=3052086 RepID=UPI00255C6D19|nr:DNA polymerase I [Propionimicrobium sp. PCR01-08-3]WIY84227.1 DNA polymerase I [Propionimicrobium sp. PCR01-08-3]
MLIDGHSMAYRAYYALPVENFATASGQHTNAVFGFTSMLINILRDERPTHVAVAFDVSRVTFRTAEYQDYKATRSKSPDEFKGQVALISEVLDALKIPHLSVDDYEADDIIATLSAQADARGWENIIVTGDRDSFQLVDGNTTVLYPVRGVSELARMTPDAIETKYGVVPARYPEVAALVGETSDNLPGVPGVGNKTAAKWLAKFDGLDNLLARADQVPGKAGDSFRAHIDDVRRNRRLNRLVNDLALDLGLDDLELHGWDRDAVHQLFDALEFRVLRDRLIEAFPDDEHADEQQGFEFTGERLGPGALAGWITEHGQGELTGVDFTGHWGSGRGDIAAVALASTDGSACWFDVADLDAPDEQAFAHWLADPGFGKAMHSAKGPMLAAWEQGWQLNGLICDTELAAYLLRPDQRSYDLADMSIRYLKRELRANSSGQEATDQQMLDFGSETTDEESDAAMLRARAVVDLTDAMSVELGRLGQRRLLDDLELPLQRILARMERTGIALDGEVLDQLHSEFDARVRSAEQAAWDSVGRQVNLGSPKQLQAVLFDQLDLPRTKKIKSGYTTDAEALEGLYVRTEHPFLEHLLAHRDSIKLRQAVDGLRKSVTDDGRVHTTYLQTIAATGRLSSADPNLQNIPIRTEEGRRIRSAFCVGEGYEALMSADYSQIEMRVMADASGDEDLIEAFRSGVDFHTVTASKVFGVPAEQITGAQRASVKQMNYGLAYGLSAYGLSTRLGVPVPEARALMDDYFTTFGGVRDYLGEVVAQARRTGYTETLAGRRRYLPDLNSSNRQRREMAERMALNAPIQGSAADIIKIAMIGLDQALISAGLKSRVLLQIHDELVLEVASGEHDQVTTLVREQMAGAANLMVPLDVSIGYGPTWLDAAH